MSLTGTIPTHWQIRPPLIDLIARLCTLTTEFPTNRIRLVEYSQEIATRKSSNIVARPATTEKFGNLETNQLK